MRIQFMIGVCDYVKWVRVEKDDSRPWSGTTFRHVHSWVLPLFRHVRILIIDEAAAHFRIASMRIYPLV